MWHSLPRLLVSLLFVGASLAQSVGFTVFPQQVVTGLTYSVAWSSNGQPATIDLLRNGDRIGALYTSDGTSNTFQWRVKDDYDGGTNYALRITSGTNTAMVDNLYVIEDEDGLVVSGSTITAPSPTSTIDLASITAISSAQSVSATATGSVGSSTATVQSGTSASAPTSTSTQRNSYTFSRGLGGAAIAGIVIGVFGAALVSGVGVWLCLRRRRAAAAKSGSDGVGAFLASGRGGRAPGTVKGTSPEVSSIPQDRHELNGGGIVDSPELYGEQFAPWNGTDRKRFYSETTSVQDNSPATQQVARKSIRYELPGDAVHRDL